MGFLGVPCNDYYQRMKEVTAGGRGEAQAFRAIDGRLDGTRISEIDPLLDAM